MATLIPATEIAPLGAHTFTPGSTVYNELTQDAGPPIAPLPDWVKTVWISAAADVRVSYSAADGDAQAAVSEYEVAPAGVRTPIRRRDGARILLSGSGAISVGLSALSVA